MVLGDPCERVSQSTPKGAWPVPRLSTTALAPQQWLLHTAEVSTAHVQPPGRLWSRPLCSGQYVRNILFADLLLDESLCQKGHWFYYHFN